MEAEIVARLDEARERLGFKTRMDLVRKLLSDFLAGEHEVAQLFTEQARPATTTSGDSSSGSGPRPGRRYKVDVRLIRDLDHERRVAVNPARMMPWRVVEGVHFRLRPRGSETGECTCQCEYGVDVGERALVLRCDHRHSYPGRDAFSCDRNKERLFGMRAEDAANCAKATRCFKGDGGILPK